MAAAPSVQTSGLTPQLKRAIAAAVVVIVAFLAGCIAFVVFYNRASRRGQPAHVGEKAHYPSALATADPEKAGADGSTATTTPVSTPASTASPDSASALLSVTPPPAAAVAEKQLWEVKAKHSWRGSLRRGLDARFGGSSMGSRYSGMSTEVPNAGTREFV